MRSQKLFAAILTALFLVFAPALAQSELPGPGITPDSPFYAFDKMFDAFQSRASVADERAAEMVAMAEKGNEAALEKARQGYERAIERRQRDAERGPEDAEGVANQTSMHLRVLSRVREQVPEQARAGIDRALNESARGRERAIEALEKQDPQRARVVAERTLQRVMEGAPEQARPGLQRALEAVRSEVRGPQQSGEAGGTPSGGRGNESGMAEREMGEAGESGGTQSGEGGGIPSGGMGNESTARGSETV